VGGSSGFREPRQRSGATDALVLTALVLFALFAVASRHRVPSWRAVALANLGVAVAYLVAGGVARRLRRPAVRAALRGVAVCGTLAYLFSAVDPLQLVVRGRWLDGGVVALEQAVFGAQPTVWLQRFVRPWLTEWMMFAYVGYLALYPLVCGAVWRRRGDGALEHCLLALAVVNVVCDVGFIVLPVAGPMAFIGDTYTVPLRGWVFTSLGELIRANLHYVGGSLPSPHCAAATVLWAMAWRYRRRLAVALVPLVLTLYLSTFYCRYHYVSDAVAGIAVAVVAVIGLARLFPEDGGAASGLPAA
jgi:membrane-associated phospholipid phosphatase